MRGIVGFLSFMLAFAIKENGALWELGLVAVSAQVGFFCGAVAAPRVRKLATEEHIIAGALVITAVVGVVTAVGRAGWPAPPCSRMTVGATGSAAKQAFDSIVQRDAPDANRGRSFARFETRFQLVWVIGALIPIIVPIPADLGFAVIAVVAVAAVVTYQLGTRGIRQGKVPVKRQVWRRRRADRRRRPVSARALDGVAADATVVGGPAAAEPPSGHAAGRHRPAAAGRSGARSDRPRAGSVASGADAGPVEAGRTGRPDGGRRRRHGRRLARPTPIRPAAGCAGSDGPPPAADAGLAAPALPRGGARRADPARGADAPAAPPRARHRPTPRRDDAASHRRDGPAVRPGGVGRHHHAAGHATRPPPPHLPTAEGRGLIRPSVPIGSGQSSGSSMRASHRPGASSSAGVGRVRSDSHRRARPSSPARSSTPATNALPRS